MHYPHELLQILLINLNTVNNHDRQNKIKSAVFFQIKVFNPLNYLFPKKNNYTMPKTVGSNNLYK